MNYLTSLERAIAYIEQHLEEELTVEDIAREAGYSLYHLTRIFTATIGEPVGSYIQKRRLSNACRTLLYSDKRVIDIAMESGFGSAEAFSRAFKTTYGVSPTAYRSNNLDLYPGSKRMLDREALKHLSGGITLTPRMVEMVQILVAGVRQEVSVLRNTIPELWQQLFEKTAQMSIDSEARGFGICESNRNQTLRSPDGNVTFLEFAGIEVESFQSLPEGVISKVIPGGRYAVFTHKGSVSNLLKTYDYIWGSWIYQTKEIIADREDFEVYDNRFLGSNHPDSEIDIYIPVR